MNDAAGDGAHHLTPRQQSAERFTDRRDGESRPQRQGARTNRRSHVVGDIIGTDVQRHVGAERGSGDQHGAGNTTADKLPGSQRTDHDEDKGEAGRNETARSRSGRILDIADPVEILVEGRLSFGFLQGAAPRGVPSDVLHADAAEQHPLQVFHELAPLLQIFRQL